ncbi:hypothetical protein [Sphingomonas sp.]|jgi:hypothetical protein|uniref:hypothetical protein n=1 Tax=Sphingomonas sp. TaxID=28214 RepID=UPI002D7F34A8|nr:hypothetical protein [Sphingomonas sp.]HEU0044229.1 hypothetical protein [Sphingomonas sp.]
MTSPLYPSYKDLDAFIDVARLKALDGFITEQLRGRLAAAADRAFYTGPFLLQSDAPDRPGSRMIELAQSREPENYYDLDRTDLWEPSAEAAAFAPLMDFIATLPFAATGRMLIMYDPSGRAVSAHKDHDSAELCHEFIWFRTNLTKPFYMLDPDTGERAYVAGHAAWFDTVNQFHGADASDELSFSIRVDGIFDDAFRSRIPFPDRNRAAAPSLWAREDQDSFACSLGRGVADVAGEPRPGWTLPRQVHR